MEDQADKDFQILVQIQSCFFSQSIGNQASYDLYVTSETAK